jgi:hypothetical protein
MKEKIGHLTKEVEHNLNSKRYSSRVSSLSRTSNLAAAVKPTTATSLNSSSNVGGNNNNNNNNNNRYLSYSDTSVNYRESYEEVEEAGGSAGFINTDGTLNLNMILKGMHAVLLKENSIKLCDLSLNIMEHLINVDLLPSEHIDKRLEQAKRSTSLSAASHIYVNNLESKYSENYYLAADLVLRNIKWLGCLYCCSHQSSSAAKSFSNDQLRGKTKLIISRLYKKNPSRFKKFFKTFIATTDINHLVEIFHALLGYCYDPSFGLNHYYPYCKFSLIKNFTSCIHS